MGCVMALGIFNNVVVGIFIYFFRWYIALVYTNSKDVIALVAPLAPIAVIIMISDGFQGSSQGILRGIGKQILIAKINIFAMWLCGLVPCALLCFVAKFGIYGAWGGL